MATIWDKAVLWRSSASLADWRLSSALKVMTKTKKGALRVIPKRNVFLGLASMKGLGLFRLWSMHK